MRVNSALVLPEFLFAFLNRQEIRELAASYMTGSSGHRRVPESFYAELRVPVAPLGAQAEVVASVASVDTAVADAVEGVIAAQRAIAVAVDLVAASSAVRFTIEDLSADIQYGLNEKMNESGVGYKIFRMNEIVQRRMVDGGQMKCADITAEEFAKYKLNRGDLLFNRTNSIEHVGKTGMFDLEGDYCFASYLIRVVPDASKVLPKFLVLMMNSAAFQAEAKGKASKSINQANINATIMRNMKVPVPTLAEQKRLVAKVEALETKIADAQAVIHAAPARKQAILQRYL